MRAWRGLSAVGSRSGDQTGRQIGAGHDSRVDGHVDYGSPRPVAHAARYLEKVLINGRMAGQTSGGV